MRSSCNGEGSAPGKLSPFRFCQALTPPVSVTTITAVTTPCVSSDLPARLVAVYKLWKNGEDLRALYPKNTFYRYRRQFLGHDIDIAVVQPSDARNVVPLVHALRPQAVAAVPDWAIGTGLYFAPNALQAAA